MVCCGSKTSSEGHWCEVAESRMRPLGIVVGDSRGDRFAGVIEPEEQGLVQKLVSHAAAEALDVGVLHRLAGRDVVPSDLPLMSPRQDRVRGELCAVVRDDHRGLPVFRDEPR